MPGRRLRQLKQLTRRFCRCEEISVSELQKMSAIGLPVPTKPWGMLQFTVHYLDGNRLPLTARAAYFRAEDSPAYL